MLENFLTNSDPQIVHSPGFDHSKPKVWWTLLDKINKLKPIKSNYDSSVITWNNKEAGFCEKSLRAKNIKHEVLGSNIQTWNNLMKFKLTVDFCKKRKNTFCIGLDSFDVIFLGDPLICIERFVGKNKKLIFNAEKKFYPDCNSKYFEDCKNHQSKMNNSEFRFLNSGAWIGYTDYCEFFFEEASKVFLWEKDDCNIHPLIKNCDQSVIHGLYKKYDFDVNIDYNCRIFQNLSNTGEEIKLNILY